MRYLARERNTRIVAIASDHGSVADDGMDGSATSPFVHESYSWAVDDCVARFAAIVRSMRGSGTSHIIATRT